MCISYMHNAHRKQSVTYTFESVLEVTNIDQIPLQSSSEKIPLKKSVFELEISINTILVCCKCSVSAPETCLVHIHLCLLNFSREKRVK